MSSRQTVHRSKALRRQLSLPEALLWRHLRERPGGFKFREQHPAGSYSLDFYCPAAALCIEVDGISHDMGDNPGRDERRDAWLLTQGTETLRIPARQVLDDPEPVVTLIEQICASRSPSTGFAGTPPLRRQGRNCGEQQ
jgi:very-short-patch-repair endonuclease